MSSDFLTAEEEQEYLHQVRFLDNVHWHDWGRCGEELQPYSYTKRDSRFHRQFCPVHKVIVNMSGWEISWGPEGYLPDINKS